MTRKQLKRYKENKEYLKQINEQIENEEKEQESNLFQGFKFHPKKLEYLEQEKLKTRALMERLLLPTHKVLKDAYLDAIEYCKDNDLGEEEIGNIIEEIASMFLCDEYNRNLYGFQWVKKDNCNDIFVSRIRWGLQILLEEDVKDIFKGKREPFENCLVVISKDPFLKHTINIKVKELGYCRSYSRLRDAIAFLEDLKAL